MASCQLLANHRCTSVMNDCTLSSSDFNFNVTDKWNISKPLQSVHEKHIQTANCHKWSALVFACRKQVRARSMSLKASGLAQSNMEEGHKNTEFSANSDSRTCLRCGVKYTPEKNSPTACRYHGHMTGDRGLYSTAPPHQGIDGEWSDASGVIVYKWNESGNRPNTGSKNWKKRWTCCGVYGEDAPKCRTAPHVSYDDGETMFA